MPDTQEQTFYLVLKDVWTTQFMRAADVFEPGKFVGRLLTMRGILPHEPLAKVLAKGCKGAPPGEWAVVGIVVPGFGSAMLPDHAILSDGNNWTPLADFCKLHHAPLQPLEESC